ncbi:TonB-linked SusC/RagA family outer membrane protein [Larkinella arboricola]|uniref:TonB-linked SusC/RagA family outer membrane protein n=1 Tax=Larkinella arboricola TaxID=643671 RepID=A0A327WRM2_LARAB|nr:TonB-dependent receptor [Larkinella arboricola]RAJ94303.1 TonB-linked SusC/RagA family outer membrane protein [Larkinella arboricola]
MKHPYLKPISSVAALVLLCLLTTVAWAQERKISGSVIDGTDKTPLPGVNVLIKGTSTGVSTDASGRFTLNVPANNNVLAISAIGYEPQEVNIGNRSEITVTLQADIKTLSEVVVTGYGSQRKKDITGAVTVVKGTDLTAVPAASLTQQLQGRAAGVTVGNDNSPGGGTMVRIRGFGTINNNSPLYIVDGVPTTGSLNNINPNDIESLQVLKDASAASIYGARAANGVVIITTKKGKVGEPKITFDMYAGIQRNGKLMDLTNSQELGQLLWEQAKNVGQTPSHAQYGNGAEPRIPDYIYPSGAMEGDPRLARDANGNYLNYSYDLTDPALGSTKFMITKANKEGTNWQDVIFNPAPIQNYQIGASGGMGNGAYAISFNHFNQQGILEHTNYKRYSIRANTEFKVKNRLKIGENLTVSYDERVGFTNNDESNPIAFAVRSHPLIPVYDVAGNFAGAKGLNLGNARTPLQELYRAKDNKTKGVHLFGNAFGELDLFKGLTFRTSFGVEYNLYNFDQFTPRDPESPEARNANSFRSENRYDNSWTWYNTLTYNRTFGNHGLNILAGTESIATYDFIFDATRSNYAFDDLDYRYLNAGSPLGLQNSGRGANRTRLFSLFGKVNYSYKEFFLADFTLRRDGSSRFSPANRYAIFPAASVGFRLSELNFMKSVDLVSDLKLRLGWGKTGNQNIPNIYNAFTLYESRPIENHYDINGAKSSIVPGFDLVQFGNPNGKWETTTSTNIGLDASLLNNKIEVVFDWYIKKTTDMLTQIDIPYTQGIATVPFTNIGDMQNKGIDLSINYNGKAMGGALRYSIGGNFSTYRNEVLKINNDPNSIKFGFATRLPAMSATKVGYPVASFYGYFIDGIFQTAEAAKNAPQFGTYNRAGSFIFRDTNGDGVVTTADRDIIGNPHPDFTYGLNLSVGYKAFDLTVFGQGVYGNDIFNYMKYWTDFNTFQGNRSKRMLYDSWRPGKTDAILPELRSTDATSAQISTYFLEKGSYLRMKNIQLSYTLPVTLQQKLGLGSTQIYVQGQNLLTFTKYSGLDPEINLRRSGDNNQDTHLGVDEGAYPVAKTMLVGLRLSF